MPNIYRDEAAGNSLFSQQYLNEVGLTNLAQIQSEQTQNGVADLAVSGEVNLQTIAGA